MTAELSAAGAATGPDPVHRITRASLWPLLLLAVANGAFLYCLPSLATHYAWSITPPINAAFMGAGYLAGLVPGFLGIFAAARWRSFRVLTLPFGVLGAVMLAATLIHLDKFFWDYPPTWLWTAVYALIPPAAVVLWVRQERRAGAPPQADPLVRPARWLGWAFGLILVAIGVALFVAPDAVGAIWPWGITTLLARTFAGWHLLMGCILIAGAIGVRRCHELTIPLLTVAAWSALLLLLPLLYANSLRPGAASLWPWVVLQAALLVACAALAARCYLASRAEGERL